jgi:hypothetical protein
MKKISIMAIILCTVGLMQAKQPSFSMHLDSSGNLHPHLQQSYTLQSEHGGWKHFFKSLSASVITGAGIGIACGMGNGAVHSRWVVDNRGIVISNGRKFVNFAGWTLAQWTFLEVACQYLEDNNIPHNKALMGIIAYLGHFATLLQQRITVI